MKHPLALFGVVLLAACASGESAVAPFDGQVTSIVITASAPSVDVGGQIVATATAMNKSGQPVAGTPISWSSASPTIASVNNTGVITGLSEGAVTIRAIAGSAFGEVSISVTRNYCSTPISLSVGEVRVLSGANAVSCVTLAPNASPSDFLFIAANGSSTPDDVGNYYVNASLASLSIAAASVTRSATLTPSMSLALARASTQESIENRLRSSEARMFSFAPRTALMPTMAASSTKSPKPRPALAVVGDTLDYRVPDVFAADLCKTNTPVRAVVRAVGRRAQVVEDVNAPAGGFDAEDFRAIAAEFDDLIYPTDSAWFGDASDMNGDGHITILYTPEVNKLTSEGAWSFVAGFFWGGDLLPRSLPAKNWSCPTSNEQEVFFLLSPDPDGSINGNARSASDVRQGTRGTIAHELQHMINQGVRQANNVSAVEATWLNEALSHFAEEAVGRAVLKVADSQRLGYSDITSNGATYQAFFEQNLARLNRWMQAPDTASPIGSNAGRQLAPRGAGWALVRYVLDRYAHGDPRTFARQLVAGPETGVQNLVARAGSPFDDLLAGFLVSAFTSTLDVPSLEARWMFASWNLRDAMSTGGLGEFPLKVTQLPAQISTHSLAGSGNYFRLTRPANSPSATFRMQESQSGGVVPFSTARLYVLRLN